MFTKILSKKYALKFVFHPGAVFFPPELDRILTSEGGRLRSYKTNNYQIFPLQIFKIIPVLVIKKPHHLKLDKINKKMKEKIEKL